MNVSIAASKATLYKISRPHEYQTFSEAEEDKVVVPKPRKITRRFGKTKARFDPKETWR